MSSGLPCGLLLGSQADHDLLLLPLQRLHRILPAAVTIQSLVDLALFQWVSVKRTLPCWLLSGLACGLLLGPLTGVDLLLQLQWLHRTLPSNADLWLTRAKRMHRRPAELLVRTQPCKPAPVRRYIGTEHAAHLEKDAMGQGQTCQADSHLRPDQGGRIVGQVDEVASQLALQLRLWA